MKKITTYFVALIIITSIFACNNDSSKNNSNKKTNEELILGSWELEGSISTYKADGVYHYKLDPIFDTDGSYRIVDNVLFTTLENMELEMGTIVSIDNEKLIINNKDRGEMIYTKVKN